MEATPTSVGQRGPLSLVLSVDSFLSSDFHYFGHERNETERKKKRNETKRNETKRDGTERRAATPKGNRWPKGQQQHQQQHQQHQQQQQQRQQQRQRRQNKQKQKETSMQRNNKTAKRHGHLPNPHGPARHAKLGKGHSFIPKWKKNLQRWDNKKKLGKTR